MFLVNKGIKLSYLANLVKFYGMPPCPPDLKLDKLGRASKALLILPRIGGTAFENLDLSVNISIIEALLVMFVL